MHTYGPDALYTDVITGGKLLINNNCYYSPSTALSFGLFESNDANTTCSGRGNNGTSYTLASWQAAGFDTLSSNVNPTFDTSNKATNASCLTKGWQNGLPAGGGGGGGGGGTVSPAVTKLWSRKR